MEQKRVRNRVMEGRAMKRVYRLQGERRARQGLAAAEEGGDQGKKGEERQRGSWSDAMRCDGESEQEEERWSSVDVAP